MSVIDMSGDGLSMTVIKRDGRREDIEFDKILTRIKNAGDALSVNHALVAKKVIDGIYDGVTTRELDEQAALICTNMSTHHPDYGKLASNIIISNHQKNTPYTFTEAISLLYNAKDIHGEHSPIISKQMYDFVTTNGDIIEKCIQYYRDFLIDYFGFKTLERAYLMKYKNYGITGSPMTIVERPQHMFMRVAIAIHLGDYTAATSDDIRTEIIKSMFNTYDITSQKYYTHATPTLYNAGTPRGQLSSCYLLAMQYDSIAGIYNTLSESAQISKYAGGIGIHLHNIRAAGSLIRGTNGISNGLVPMLRVFNDSARYVDQCFTPDTVVFTSNGPKRIEDICISDKVLTSSGKYHNVNKPVRHEYNGDMLNFVISGSDVKVTVTPVHNILALRGQLPTTPNHVVQTRLASGQCSVDYYECHELSVGDFIVFPIPKYEKDIDMISEDDCKLYGMLLSDGTIITKKSITLEVITVDAYYFVKNYCELRNIKFSVEGMKFNWSFGSSSFKFTYSQFYDVAGNKQMDSSFIHLPENKVMQIVDGIFSMVEDGDHIQIPEYISENVKYICMRFGNLTPIMHKHGQTYINITNDLNYFVYDGSIYSRIESITTSKYSGIVHDFEIDTVHDYTIAHLGVVHNGGGKRPGSIAMYLEPWHADILDFLELKLNTGNEERRARDLFYALWIPDLFMERLAQAVTTAETGDNPDKILWTLMCPNECPGLSDVWGSAFKELYEKYEKAGKGRKSIPILQIWNAVIKAQIETGTPYLCYKDAANAKSNQQNLGTIKSSNLCSEIIEYSSPTETAVCNLASVCLPMFINPDKTYNYELLRYVVSVAVRNLDRVIDINFYPTENTSRSNFRHRPIGIGVQGLADTFAIMKIAYDSLEARELNKRIFAHMYYAAVETSAAIAKERGSYSSFVGSPASEGRLQFDLWNVKPIEDPALDWDALHEKAKEGLRNSLLMAPMPTASTSQILGFNEAFESFTSNIYTRNTSAGNFIIINKYLIRELIDAGVWSPEVRMSLIASKGSIQGISTIPDAIKTRYKTVWETKQRVMIDMSADRGAYICQSQSLNLFVASPTPAILTSMHLYSWKQGLKTGIYYLRTLPKSEAQQFTVEPIKKSKIQYESDDETSESDDEEAGEGAPAPLLLSDKEKRKAELRAAMTAGTYDSGEGQCINCGS